MSTLPPRQLGNSDVKVSPVIFGAWAIGGWMWGGNDDDDAIAAIRASLDAGVTTIDTAAIYGMGHSEELVAKAVAGRRRDQVVIATKCGMRWDGPENEGSDPWPQKDNAGKDVVIRKNARPASILYECEQSLKRLKTDVIDLYQIHWPDTSTPVEDSMSAMVKLKEQGKIRAIGVSNYDEEWLARAIKVAPVASNQPPYSIIQRTIEERILPFARKHNLATIVYSPMERGLLTGAVTMDRKFAPGDHRAGHKFFRPENRRKVLNSLEKIKPIAQKHNASLAQLIINWTIHEPGITAALVGARNPEQAQHNAAAMTFTLTADERSQIRQAFDQTSHDLMTAT
jgi:aryl-alcohol dehydrogenase-like predicted oxidoreductase